MNDRLRKVLIHDAAEFARWRHFLARVKFEYLRSGRGVHNWLRSPYPIVTITYHSAVLRPPK